MRPFLLVILCAVPLTAASASDPQRPVGWGIIESPPADAPLRAPHAPPSPAIAAAYPLFAWPLDRTPRNGLVVVNYADHDATGALLDYSGGAHTYDGHRGTDLTLYNFRAMDRGAPVYAAAPGTVAFIGAAAPGAFDRWCEGIWTDDGNWVWVAHGDGTYSEYFHLRAYSMTVAVGESVATGQLLGMIGSSGYSTAPHLHFEAGDYFSGSYAFRDPFTGPSNPLPSLWVVQEPYAGDDSLWFADQGVYSQNQVGGNIFNTRYCDTQEGLQQPLVFGIDEPIVAQWYQFQGNAGDDFRIEVVRPNSTIFAAYDDSLRSDARFDWFWVYWFWDGAVSMSDAGIWKLRSYANGSVSRETTFRVGASTVNGPRLRRAGRSFRINGAPQSDTLRVTPWSPPVTYALVGAPATVTLADSVLTIGATSPQTTRSAFFQVVATDAFSGRADTAFYHVVDMSKPHLPPVGVSDSERRPSSSLALSASPRPSRGPLTVQLTLADPALVTVDVHDARGRLVRALSRAERGPGVASIHWNGRDDEGRPVPPGVYAVHAVAGTIRESALIVIVE